MASHRDLESARAGLSVRRLIARPRTDRVWTRSGEQGDQAIHLDRGTRSGRRSAFGQRDRHTRLSRPGRLPGHVPAGLSANRAYVPLCLVPSVVEVRPDVRRRVWRGRRSDGDAGPRTPGRGAGDGRAMDAPADTTCGVPPHGENSRRIARHAAIRRVRSSVWRETDRRTRLTKPVEIRIGYNSTWPRSRRLPNRAWRTMLGCDGPRIGG